MHWTIPSRVMAFLLGFSSIAALIAHFYGVGSMHVFVPAVTLPCFLALGMWVRVARRRRWREVQSPLVIGVVAGFVAAIAVLLP